MAARPVAGEGAPSPAAEVRSVWSLRALRDVEEIYRYVAADKPDAARKLAGKLLLAGDQLALHPYLGREASAKGMRELIVGSYLLVYRVREDVEIVTLLHGARRKKRR